MASSFNSLLSFTTAMGSINTVEPLEDWSCIMPEKLFLPIDRAGSISRANSSAVMR